MKAWILTVPFVVLALMPTGAAPGQQSMSAEQRLEARRARFPEIEPARQMVENRLLPQKGLHHPAVIDVMKRVPRHRFVPPPHRSMAYQDQAIAIGGAQTISPPYVVAFMTEQLDPKLTDKVLEIGTGSGYQAAVLSLLVDEVYTVEIVRELGERAQKQLADMGFDNVHVRVGDGYQGWPEAAPFDSIIVTCSPESVPQPLIDQLKEGGRMIIPVGRRYQQTFYLYRKTGGKLVRERLTEALFVPMTGQAEELRQVQPDASKPSLLGGDFETVREDGSPVGWHYARNMQIVPYDAKDPALTNPKLKEIAGVPEGKSFARFVSEIVEAPADARGTGPVKWNIGQILQGFAVDGRKVERIVLEYSMRGKDVVSRQNRFQTPTALITFFDAERRTCGEVQIGRCRGTFGWRRIVQEIVVPSNACEAILLIGLPGASGRLDVDNIVLRTGTK